ncbi:MAG TPA: hypothetical protein VIX73_05665 [Kofleriaceae bacterium]
MSGAARHGSVTLLTSRRGSCIDIDTQMLSHDASIDRKEALSTLLARYEHMERATAPETEWIALEVAVNQAFVDAERVFLNAAALQAADADDARYTEEHLNALVSLRKRIEGQVALAKAREQATSNG